jgi:hypothetical protein
MENQHQQIKGYRDLTQGEIDAMNEGKALAVQVGEWIDKCKANPELDQRWIAIGATDLQKGFMSAIRGIAKPTTF